MSSPTSNITITLTNKKACNKADKGRGKEGLRGLSNITQTTCVIYLTVLMLCLYKSLYWLLNRQVISVRSRSSLVLLHLVWMKVNTYIARWLYCSREPLEGAFGDNGIINGTAIRIICSECSVYRR